MGGSPSLRHPALPKVSDHFAEGGGQFLVMEYITGDDLGQMLDRNHAGFTPGQVLEWTDQILEALEYCQRSLRIDPFLII